MSVTFQGDEGSGFGLIDPLKKQIAALTTENERLRAVLHRIAYEPIGHAEATDRHILDDITDIAREALSRKAAP